MFRSCPVCRKNVRPKQRPRKEWAELEFCSCPEHIRNRPNRREYMRDYMREYMRHHSQDQRAYHLKTKYGISTTDYEELVGAQDGVCAICGEECPSGRRLAVDHCHETQAVRGLLCVRCNIGLGNFRDDPELLEKAAAYLRLGISTSTNT